MRWGKIEDKLQVGKSSWEFYRSRSTVASIFMYVKTFYHIPVKVLIDDNLYNTIDIV